MKNIKPDNWRLESFTEQLRTLAKYDYQLLPRCCSPLDLRDAGALALLLEPRAFGLLLAALALPHAEALALQEAAAHRHGLAGHLVGHSVLGGVPAERANLVDEGWKMKTQTG